MSSKARLDAVTQSMRILEATENLRTWSGVAKESAMPTRTEWLLRYIGGTEHYDDWVDRIRLMKGMFLFQKEGGAPREVDYRFEPYDYGPFTQEVYRDLGSLANSGFLAESADGQSYRITQEGRRHLSAERFPPGEERALVEIRVEVSDLSFRDLLRRVYQAYPESASRSVAKDVLR